MYCALNDDTDRVVRAALARVSARTPTHRDGRELATIEHRNDGHRRTYTVAHGSDRIDEVVSVASAPL